MKKWLKILLIIFAVLIVLFLLLALEIIQSILYHLFVTISLIKPEGVQEVIGETIDSGIKPDEETIKPGEVRLNKNYINLPFRNITFKVKVPRDTEEGDQLFMAFFNSPTHDTPYRIEFLKNSEFYEGVAELPEGALIRYKYETSRGEGGWSLGDKETLSSEIPLNFRYLYIHPELKEVEDTIAMWEGKSSNFNIGIVKGKVTDKTGKEIEAIVSIAGAHIPTDYYGNYELDIVPVGKQNIIVTTPLGNYEYGYNVVDVEGGKTKEVNFELEPRKKVTVIFNLEILQEIADEMPWWAVPRIVGSIYQLGATRWQWNELEWKMEDRQLQMKKTAKGKFTASVDLYEGMYVDYAYYIGTNEKGQKGLSLLRAFVVNSSKLVINDTLFGWKEKNVDFPVIITVEIPPNTPKTVPIFMDGGGMSITNKISGDKYGIFMYHSGSYSFDYAYSHGEGYIGFQGWEATKDDKYKHPRRFQVNNSPLEQNDKVERWRLYSIAKRGSANEPRKVKFIVAIPHTTPQSDVIYLKGNVPELQEGIKMEKLSDTIYEKEVIFSSEKEIKYYYTRENSRDEEAKRKIKAEYDGQIVIDAVNSWQDISFQYPEKIIGVQLEDYWNPNLLTLLPSTLDNLKLKNIEWVDFPVIWNWIKIGTKTRLSPIVPTSYQGSSIYPTPDIKTVLTESKLRNMKMALDGFIIGTPEGLSLDEQFQEIEKYSFYLADIAQENNVDILILPFIEGDPSIVNEKMKELIRKVRQKYFGKIAVNGISPTGFEFENYEYQKEADYIIYNFFEDLNITSRSETIFKDENGEDVCCIFSSDAIVSELRSAIESVLEEKFKKAYEKYQKPILFNQLGFASFDGSTFKASSGFNAMYYEGDPWRLDLTEQANLYEAFYQAIENKDWVEGGFSFNYPYTDFPLSRGYDIRSKPAEAILNIYSSSTR